MADLQEAVAAETLHVALELVAGGDPDEALAVLRQHGPEAASAPSGREGLGAAYRAVAEALLREGRTHSALAACDDADGLLGAGCPALLASREAAFRMLAQAERPAEVTKLLKALCSAGAGEEGGCSAQGAPSEAIFNCCIDCAIRSGACREAWECLELALLRSRRVDKYFVSILAKSLETQGDRALVQRGLGLVDLFIEGQPDNADEIVFNSLLNVLCKVGDMSRLRSAFAKMQRLGIAPSAVTYGTVAKAYGRAQDTDAVLKIWKDMRDADDEGLVGGRNPVTFGCILDACVRCGHMDKAMTIFQEMRSRGMSKSTVLYAIVIKGLAKSKDLARALHLYKEMRLQSVPLNVVTFNSLIDACVRCSDMHTATLLVQDMTNMGIGPDLITFSTLIKAYSKIGAVDQALALARALKSRGLRCDEIVYNSLIDGCARASRPREGLEVFDEMMMSSVPPSNITFSILVKMYFNASCPDEAFRLIDEMPKSYRCLPSRVVYAQLASSAAQHGGRSLARAAAVFDGLAGRRGAKLLDAGIIGVLLTGCVQHGDLETAVSLAYRCPAGGPTVHGPRGEHCPAEGVPAELRGLPEAPGRGAEARGRELVQHLQRRKALSSPQLRALEGALGFPSGEAQRAAKAAASVQALAWTPEAPSDGSPPRPQPAGLVQRSAAQVRYASV